MSELRKVAVFNRERSKVSGKTETVMIGYAFFHGWGSDYEEFTDGVGNFSTAILEKEDGTVLNHPAQLIEFIKELEK